MANGAMAVAAAGTSEPRVNAGRRRAAMGALVAVTAMSAAAGARGFVGAAVRDPVRMVSETWRSGAQPLSAANSVPTAAAASEDARPAPWSVVGALVAVHTASVADEGDGTWRVRLVAEIVGRQQDGLEVTADRLQLIGQATPIALPLGRAVRLGLGQSVRREFAWRLTSPVRPGQVRVMWRADDGRHSTVRSVDVASDGATPWAIRVLTPRPDRADLRIEVGTIARHTPTYGPIGFRVNTTITNTGDDAVDLARAGFVLHLLGAGDATMQASDGNSMTGYSPVVSFCQTGASMLGTSIPIRPGETVHGSLCFSETVTAPVAPIVTMTFERDAQTLFTGRYEVDPS